MRSSSSLLQCSQTLEYNDHDSNFFFWLSVCVQPIQASESVTCHRKGTFRWSSLTIHLVFRHIPKCSERRDWTPGPWLTRQSHYRETIAPYDYDLTWRLDLSSLFDPMERIVGFRFRSIQNRVRLPIICSLKKKSTVYKRFSRFKRAKSWWWIFFMWLMIDRLKSFSATM